MIMKFVNFGGIPRDRPTSEVSVRGIVLNLHNEWNFTRYEYHLPSSRFTLEWRNARNPEVICNFEFGGVKSVRVEPADSVYPRDHAEGLFTMVYQELEGETPFVKFWFEDQSTVEIAAESLTLDLDPKEALTLDRSREGAVM